MHLKVYIEKRIIEKRTKFLRRDRGSGSREEETEIFGANQIQNPAHEGRPAGGRKARSALCHDAHELCRGEHAGLGHVGPDVAQDGFELTSGLTLVSYLSFYLNQIINITCYYRQQAAEFY